MRGDVEWCGNCGREVLVMCWKNTGFCCEACKEEFEAATELTQLTEEMGLYASQ